MIPYCNHRENPRLQCAVRYQSRITNDSNVKCMLCGAVMMSGRRIKHCSPECTLKNSAAPARCYIEIAVL